MIDSELVNAQYIQSDSTLVQSLIWVLHHFSSLFFFLEVEVEVVSMRHLNVSQYFARALAPLYSMICNGYCTEAAAMNSIAGFCAWRVCLLYLLSRTFNTV